MVHATSGEAYMDDQAEAYKPFENLCEFLYQLPKGHPSRFALHTTAVVAYCHRRDTRQLQ